MSNKDVVLKKIKEENERRIIAESLDPKEFPETIQFLLEYDDAQNLNSYQIASEIVTRDRTSNLPRNLFNYIVKLYKEAIDEGNADAMNDLGALYYDGRGCEQDFTKAVYYYDMAAKNGCRLSQENLGYCYYYGRNFEIDYKKAFHYFALGAFDGHLISLYKIGDMYKNGYYVEKNPNEVSSLY